TAADHPPFSELTNAQVRKWVRACFSDSADLTIRFVGPIEGRALNKDYRGKDYATNVLTFPVDFFDLTLEDDQNNAMPTFISDIVICTEVIEKEAKEQGKDTLHHLAHMIVHGCLHAQGFVHEGDEEAVAMETREIEILKQFGINNPYETTAE
ncbi:MAG: rRNA maturation RNase YbeY, partial [Limnobacter sp.]|nr:rRNA maturation RNase YbeY [Limnobacter sp.]